ncbi:hypothetical protein HRM2_39400 [Desulforapulum autotrophicum HRM2]|uniref:Uncharacterized protein n=1 Tax=Desulforapulum autotrophicum (strain ATCC 43914 / DSM 3382 / VKM B-1955 / HRM2) TaxID=177437 RepID=C0QBJ6_DESAH|nr:hypothetical protein HRM2_39400 [Desulforapulum autotrophicum HRM2]
MLITGDDIQAWLMIDRIYVWPHLRRTRALPFSCLVSVHARYTRDEILAGLVCLTLENRIKLR